jgi:glycosyltransferase involved in cell wall biosynthesis
MKIGILGTRGIPNQYGGFEQFAQCLSLGLVQKGHEVSVYNSNHHPYKEKEWQGVRIIHCNDWEKRIGTAGQFVYDLNCINDARKRNFDILIHLGYTSDSVWHWRWPKKTIHIVNMDGLEWKREKYGRLTRRFLKWAESLAAKHADALIADSPGIQEHLLTRYNKPSVYIPYGADLFAKSNEDVLKQFDLLPHCYSLLVARMEPENNIEMIIKGHLASEQEDPLFIVGNTANHFGKHLTKTYRGLNVIFAGPIYDQDVLNNLRFFSALYFHGHSAGGTNPSLLEAMACGCNIAAHNNIFNRAVLGNEAYYFSSADEITRIINLPKNAAVINQQKEINMQKIKTTYAWEKIITEYESLMLDTIKRK